MHQEWEKTRLSEISNFTSFSVQTSVTNMNKDCPLWVSHTWWFYHSKVGFWELRDFSRLAVTLHQSLNTAFSVVSATKYVTRANYHFRHPKLSKARWIVCLGLVPKQFSNYFLLVAGCKGCNLSVGRKLDQGTFKNFQSRDQPDTYLRWMQRCQFRFHSEGSKDFSSRGGFPMK